ncbi:ras-related protein Rab-34-like [Cloeon dipterum]|uniref:ras-related protein Rab-34-like n=1 Tax=Cloeon dipterum TaxID=197152 RepID=UPI00321FC142
MSTIRVVDVERSPIRVMMQAEAVPDRTLACFPVAFRNDASPYSGQKDFSKEVRAACRDIHRLPRLAKVVFIGDCGVGKTCLINRFCKRIFDCNYKMTIGVDFEVERFDIIGVPFSLQMWDTAGQERFRSIATSYYRGANALVLVFDMTDLETLKNSRQWMNEAMAANWHGPKPLVFLVGTKKDLLLKTEPSIKLVEAKAAQMSRELGAELWLLSSCTGDNVLDFFFRLAALNFDRSISRELEMITARETKFGFDLVSPKRLEKPKPTTSRSSNNCC